MSISETHHINNLKTRKDRKDVKDSLTGNENLGLLLIQRILQNGCLLSFRV